MTDPISDLLIRLVNASRVGKLPVAIPFSGYALSILEVLRAEGYLAEVTRRGKKGSERFIDVTLAVKNGKPSISGGKRLSKPSQRSYMGVSEINPIKTGLGRIIISTSKGVMTGESARKAKVGGEPLFLIW